MTRQHNIQHNATYNTTHNTTQHNTTQHTTQHNTTQHKNSHSGSKLEYQCNQNHIVQETNNSTINDGVFPIPEHYTYICVTFDSVPPMSMPNQGMGGSGSGPNSWGWCSSPSERGWDQTAVVRSTYFYLLVKTWRVCWHPTHSSPPSRS